MTYLMKLHQIGMEFTTPQPEVLENENIKTFLETLSSEKPIFLEVQKIKKKGAKPLECYDNVKLCIDEKMGEQQLGWIIWYQKDLLKAEAHSVLKTPEGELIDVTPQIDGEKSILFVPDNSLIDDGRLILSKYIALNETDEILECIKIAKEIDKKNQEMYDLRISQNSSSQIKKNKVGRNAPCTCGSGKKYKKCCGK